MIIFCIVVAAITGVGAISFEAGQANPDTKNIFTSIEEKNRL
jgi:hypothetical protein